MAVRQAVLSAKSFTASMSALAKRVAWQEAIALFEGMRNQSIQADAFSYSVLSSACDKASQWALALQSFVEMQRQQVQPSVVNFACAISACRHWHLALYLGLEELPSKSLAPDAAIFNALMSACSRAAQSQRSLLLFELMSQRGIRQSLVTLGALLAALTKGQKWREVLGLLDQLPKKPKASQRSSVVICFNTALSALHNATQWRLALQLLRRFDEEQLTPTVISWNSTMSACERAQQWQMCLELLREMRQEVSPTMLSFNVAINSCQQVAGWPCALKLLEEAKEIQLSPDTISFTNLISSLAASGEWQRSLCLLAEMNHQHLKPSVLSYNSAMTACNKSSESGPGASWQWALRLFHALPSKKVAPDALSYNIAMSALERGGDWTGALWLLEAAGPSPYLRAYGDEDQVEGCWRFRVCQKRSAPARPWRFFGT